MDAQHGKANIRHRRAARIFQLMTKGTSVKPDPRLYNPGPRYLRELITDSGLTQKQAAKAIGHNERTMRYWLNGKHTFPYTVQFTMEALTRYKQGLTK